MPLYVPSSQDFKYVATNATARPAAAYGATVTPGQNTMGSYVSVLGGGSIIQDCFGILINVNSIAVSAQAKDALLTIGRDPAGGSAFIDWLTNLVVSCAAPYNVGSGGVWYYFPMFLKSGTSIGAKAQVNNATVGTARVNIWAFGQPRKPESVRVATVFRSFGQDTTNSRGTLVTPGTTAEGAYTQLGSATDIPLWWWQYGFGTNDTTMTAAAIHCDIGAGNASNKKLLIQDGLICVSAAEQINNSPLTAGCVANVASGDVIYGRCQSSAAADTNTSMAAYGCG